MSDYNNKTENFFTRHAKLIAFLGTVAVFLAIFGPILFFETADFYKNKPTDDRPQMTLLQLITLAEQGEIRPEQLTAFASTETVSDKDPNRRTIRLSIEKGKFMVFAVADDRYGVVVECYMWDMKNENGASYDVLNQDLRSIFIK